MILFFICSQALCNFEEDIYVMISKDWQVKPVTYFMEGTSFLSSPMFDVVPPMALYLCNEKKAAKHGFVGFVSNCFTVFSLKYLINRQRPDGEFSRWKSSFPSGHAAFAFSQAVVYSHHYPKFRIPLYLFATTVGFSRVYLGKHYPTDIIGGAALGLLTGFLTIKLCE